MHLIFATQDYALASVPMASFPIVLWEDMTSCLEANQFLRYYLARGAIESKRSWAVIGRSLYDYFGFLEAHGLKWDDVTRGDDENLVAAYRRYSFELHGLRRNTVRLRLTYICAFYDFALSRGWISKLPYDYETRRSMRAGGILAHTDNSGGEIAVRSVMPRKHRSLIKFLSQAQARAVRDGTNNEHHRIIIRLALGSGLRREELATFPCAYVIDPDQVAGRPLNIEVTLDPNDGTGMRTKGQKRRVIYMRHGLMKALYHYRERLRGERASNNPAGDPRALFLTEAGIPWADSGKGIEAMVRKVGLRIGIRVHPHMLRHTYATHTLVSLQRLKSHRMEPLVFLQRQLGHSSINTTMEYLHIVNEHVDDAVLAYDAENDDWQAGAQ